jgi:hypothetical protein
MKSIFILFSVLILSACGKNQEKVTQSSLQLSGIQSTGVNLGATTKNGQRVVVVTCSGQSMATNAQRQMQLSQLQMSFKNGSFVNFTIAGLVLSPMVMQNLLQQAIQSLNFSMLPNQCPADIIALAPVN